MKFITDDQGNYLFFHYGRITGKRITPSKWGTNAHTSDRRRVGVSYYYISPEDKEGMISGDLYVVKVDPDSVYNFNLDPLNLYDVAKRQFTNDHPQYVFDAPAQMDFMHPLIAKAGYDMVIAKWGKTYRGETIKPLPYDAKLTNLYRTYGKVNPDTKDVKSEIAKTIINKLSVIANSATGVASGVTDRFYAANNNIKKIINDPILVKHIGPKLMKSYAE
jgi:hypothetical protein